MTRPSQPRRPALVGLVAGLCLLAAAIVLLVYRPTAAPAGMQVTDVGSVPAATTQPSPSSPAVGISAGVPAPSSIADAAADVPRATVPPVTPSTGRPAPVPAPDAPTAPPTSLAPTAVSLPTLGVAAMIAPVGLDPEGSMEVPTDVGTVGWYRFGPAPGDSVGSAVLTGHVDSADQGRGVFAELGLLSPGDPIEVTGADGVARRYDVVARESWPKDEIPLDRLFERSGPGRLVLITCGGAFDPTALSYEENIAVTAVLAG